MFKKLLPIALIATIMVAGCGEKPIDRKQEQGHPGVDVNLILKEGMTLLHIAAGADNQDLASFLINNGGNKEAVEDENGYTPLHVAAMNSGINIAGLLIKEGANIEATDNDYRTPLHLAAEYDDKDIAGLLIDKGANIEATDSDGRTPLHLAARSNMGINAHQSWDIKGSIDVAGLLIDKGANKKAIDNDGSTPFYYAESLGRTEIVNLFTNPAE